MKKLVIPLYIPLKKEKVDYESLKNIIDSIEHSIILIGDYGLNSLNEIDYINIYLYLSIINQSNEYYYEKEYDDKLIKNLKVDDKKHYVSILGNIFSNELNEYLANEENGVIDQSLNEYLKIFNKVIKNDGKDKIEYILLKKKKINNKQYKEIDNLIGINEL